MVIPWYTTISFYNNNKFVRTYSNQDNYSCVQPSDDKGNPSPFDFNEIKLSYTGQYSTFNK